MKEEATALARLPGEALVAQGAALVRLENDTQIQIAVQRPRDEAKILAAAKKELELYPSMAREALYTKPVGKDEEGNKVNAEGLSIRAAESLANRWDNSSYAALVEEDDPDKDYAVIAAIFLDYEKNTRHVAEARVARMYKSRGGQIVRYSPDRFDTVIKANQSKLLREILLRSLPAGLKKEYENKVRQILKGEPIGNIRKALIERLADLNIQQSTVEQYKGKTIAQMPKEDLMELVGMVNAIRDGEMSPDVFGPKKDEKKVGQQSGLIPE